MTSGDGKAVLSHIRQLAAEAGAAELPDGELLGRFLRDRDEAAFTVLVQRHGPMVFALCRRLLQHAQDAEDACQATFLILARKAASILRQASLASWLHGVAFRVCSKLQASRRAGRRPAV